MAYLESDESSHAAAARAMLKTAVGASSAEEIGAAMSAAGRDIAQLTRAGGRSLLSVLRQLGARRVPPRCALVEQTAGAFAAFAAPGIALPASAGAYDRTGLKPRRVGAVVTQADELLRADPSIVDAILAADVADAVAFAVDAVLLDFSAAPDDGSPGGLAYGAPSVSSSGTSTTDIDGDLAAAQQSLTDAGHSLSASTWAMHSSTLATMQARRVGSGTHAWPTLHAPQPTLHGRPVFATAAVPRIGSPGTTSIALIDASAVRFVDDDNLAIEVSRQATVEMTDAPSTDGLAGTGASLVSTWQAGLIAILGSRFVAWKLARATGACTIVGIEL